MPHSALLHDHRHDRILVRPPPLLVHTHDLVDAHAAHQVARDEHKVRRDDAVRVDVPHRVARRERLPRGHDRHDLEPGAGLGPFGVSVCGGVGEGVRRGRGEDGERSVLDGGFDELGV